MCPHKHDRLVHTLKQFPDGAFGADLGEAVHDVFKQVDRVVAGRAVTEEDVFFEDSSARQFAEPVNRFLAQIANDIRQSRYRGKVALAGLVDQPVLISLNGDQNIVCMSRSYVACGLRGP